MKQNTSTAVMQRRIEPHDSLDDFPTPPWATRAFVQHVLMPKVGALRGETVLEPCCNRGCMALPLAEYFNVRTSDIHDYGWEGQQETRDFLIDYPEDLSTEDQADWVIANLPFRLAVDFIEKGLRMASRGVAVLVRVAFGEGIERFERLYRNNPPTIIAFYVERVPMVRGRFDPAATTATAYFWLVWAHDQSPKPPVWIPPCRKLMERPSDMDLAERQLASVTRPAEALLFDEEIPPEVCKPDRASEPMQGPARSEGEAVSVRTEQ